MSKKFKLMTYTAGAIEHVSKKDMKSWRDIINSKLEHSDLLIYDPVQMEASKVGQPPGEHVAYVKSLKQAGHFDHFMKEMSKIWFGQVSPNGELIDILKTLRVRKYTDGNTYEDDCKFGDAEAVVRSDFIILYLPKDHKTVGSIYEVFLALMFHIPIYLILPDCVKTDANSSLLWAVILSEGKVFYNISACCKFIQKKYNLARPA